jgi:26S proteasome regulatory subunit N12
MELADVTPTFEALRAAFAKVSQGGTGPDLAQCTELLAKLKKPVTVFALSGDQKKLLLARETLEIGALTSILSRDMAAFERYVTQLKTYYLDFATLLAPSARQQALQGLLLLHLLSDNRIGEFHTELEVIPAAAQESEHIRTAIELERYMMDGNYQVLINGKEKRPEYFSFFMDQLLETVRSKVAVAMEKSYSEMGAADAAKMLMLSSVKELEEFARQENERKADLEKSAAEENAAETKLATSWKAAELGDVTMDAKQKEVRWVMTGSVLKFQRPSEVKVMVSALDLIGNTIGYASNIERIV